MKISGVNATSNYVLRIALEDGSEIKLNMEKIKRVPNCRLNDISTFLSVKYEGTAIYWNSPNGGTEYYPLRLVWDNPQQCKNLYPLRLTLDDIFSYLR